MARTRLITLSDKSAQALVKGERSMTRRIKPPRGNKYYNPKDVSTACKWMCDSGETSVAFRIWDEVQWELNHPFKVGDTFWVRECFRTGLQGEWVYRADHPEAKGPWFTSLSMSPEASRYTLRVVSIRVCRASAVPTALQLDGPSKKNEVDPWVWVADFETVGPEFRDFTGTSCEEDNDD